MDLSKLSQNAREAVDVAQAVVRRGRSNALGTEHLLLGLLAQQGGVVHQVFEELSLDLGLAQWKTNDAIKRNDLSRSRAAPPETDAPVHLTPRAKRALELANEEANGAASPLAAGTEHLLLGPLARGRGQRGHGAAGGRTY
jgi:ATP-dependent Clp protease ATP-binding subunit ClpC